MLNLGTGEVLLILVIALLVLGPNKLPTAARQAGRALAELRRMSTGFQSELRDALHEPVATTPATPAAPAATPSVPAPELAPDTPGLVADPPVVAADEQQPTGGTNGSSSA